MRAPGRLLVRTVFLAAAVLLVGGAAGIHLQTPETADFTPHLMLLLAMPLCALSAWLRTAASPRAPWLAEPVISYRHRLRILVALGILWLVIGGAVILHFHVLLEQGPTRLSLGAGLGHLGVGLMLGLGLFKTARRTKLLDDPFLSLDSECRIGGRLTAFVAQPVRRPVRLQRWEIALVCQETRRRWWSKVTDLLHEDRREVVAGRTAHRGEILHGGGVFELPVTAPPDSPPEKGLPRVDWYLDSVLMLEGAPTFASRFRVSVAPARER